MKKAGMTRRRLKGCPEPATNVLRSAFSGKVLRTEVGKETNRAASAQDFRELRVR